MTAPTIRGLGKPDTNITATSTVVWPLFASTFFFFRFQDCDGFADINFCDMISEVKCNFATSPKRTTSTRDAVDWALYCLNWSFCIGTCSQHKICPMVPSGLDIDTNSFAYMMRMYELHTWPSLNSRVNSFSFISKKKKSLPQFSMCIISLFKVWWSHERQFFTIVTERRAKTLWPLTSGLFAWSASNQSRKAKNENNKLK